jgi:hypothetical protein
MVEMGRERRRCGSAARVRFWWGVGRAALAEKTAESLFPPPPAVKAAGEEFLSWRGRGRGSQLPLGGGRFRPVGAGFFWRCFPRVARRFASLHPWLGTFAPLGLWRGATGSPSVDPDGTVR